MAIEQKGGMTIPDGIDDVLAALPSSIPPEMFEEDETAAPIPAIPRAAVPRPMPPPMRLKAPPPLPARAKGGPVVEANRAPAFEPAPAHGPRPSQRPTLTPDVIAALPSVDLSANERAAIESPSSMSAVMVPAALDSREKNGALPIEDSDDHIVLPGVSQPSMTKKLLVAALAAAVTFVVVRKIETKHSVPVAASPAVAISPAPTQAKIDPPPAIVDTPPTKPSSAEIAEPEQAATTAPPSDQGSIDTASALGGRRVFVDGHVVGQTPASMLVKCGAHKVKVGSAGHVRKIDVPCGGSIALGDF